MLYITLMERLLRPKSLGHWMVEILRFAQNDIVQNDASSVIPKGWNFYRT
jgi:hypothetical protein